MVIRENVEDLTNLNDQGKIVVYPDIQNETYLRALIRINDDQRS